ncbi:uncharacterized protein LOC111265283 isoform X2 [Varroa jacobsoni]|uniref:uncharacterized protein LOC111265283 isoform X2 n=1 Tax=Varroa jacobsoni TaxID=62625 RepID=UPI000BF81ADB|nr:uncharacterized protein LOC111265283 isoform X2 [Varroa jacobsoni]
MNNFTNVRKERYGKAHSTNKSCAFCYVTPCISEDTALVDAIDLWRSCPKLADAIASRKIRLLRKFEFLGPVCLSTPEIHTICLPSHNNNNELLFVSLIITMQEERDTPSWTKFALFRRRFC